MRASLLLNDQQLRLRALEKGWNDKISKDRESKRLVAMSEDIREFIANSMLGDNKATLQEQKNALESSMSSSIDGQMASPTAQSSQSQDVSPLKTNKSTGVLGMKKNKKGFDRDTSMGIHSSLAGLDLKQVAFGTIANTLNYKHQEGTDYDTELRILKCVMTRESQLLKLKHLIDNSEMTQPHADGTTSIALKENIGLKILEELLHIRNVTLDYLENLHQWRVSAPKLPNANLDGPRVFLWEGYNYTMKVISDLDFLADREVLVGALSQNPDKMRANPLMLQATLEESADSWVDPALQASYDANNMTSGPLYEERLRLRNAERLLLVEIEYNAAYMPGDEGEQEKGNASPSDMNGEPESLSPNSQNNNNIADSNDDMKGRTWQKQMSEEIKSLAMENMSQENRPESKNSTRAESRRGLGTSGSRSNLVGDLGATEPGESGANQNGFGDGIAFLQFDGVEEQVMPLEGDMQQYDAYLTGNNILPPIDNFDATNMPFDSDRIDNDVLLRFSKSEDDISTKMSIASSLTIDSVSMYDLEVIINISTPPRSVMLAGAICVILLTEGKTLPTNVSWEGFRDLVISKNQTLASSMNTLDPRTIPAFKLRAIKPFVDKLTLSRSQLDSITGGMDGSLPDQLSDVLGSIASASTFGLDVPLEAAESVERLFRWTRQVYNATEKGKKRRKGKRVNKDIQDKDSKAATKVGTGKIDKNVKAKAEQQKMRTGRMAQGKTGMIRKKKNHVAAMELWPVHTEILENVFKHPLLLTILSSQQSGFNQSSAHVLKLRKQILQYDPLNIAGRGVDVPPEKVVAKIYNLVDSKEASININIRDYTMYLYQMREKYSHDVVEYFQPASVIWWVQNLRSLIQVRQKANKNLVFMVSKQAIERHVTRAMGIYDSKSVEGSHMSVPLSGISMPASLPSAVNDELNNMQRNPNVSNNEANPIDNELNLNDWDFYESDFGEEDISMNMGDISSPMDMRDNQPLSRQEMRQQFMQQQTQQQQQQQKQMYTQHEIEEAHLLQQQQQEQLQRQRPMEMPEATDYGEDVFEDDGEGEFEAEVDRATQLSRTISREKPLSAPGSLSAPHSFASNPTDAINNSIPNLSAGAGRNANYNQGQGNPNNNNNQDYDDYDDGGYASDKAVEQTDNKADSGGDSIASEEEVAEINIVDTTAPVVDETISSNEVIEEVVAEVTEVTDAADAVDEEVVAKDKRGTEPVSPTFTVTDLVLPSLSIGEDSTTVAGSLSDVIEAVANRADLASPTKDHAHLASPSQSTIGDMHLQGESSILSVE